MNIALIGATGLVGQKMINVLEDRKLSCSGFFPAASERSVGKPVQFMGDTYRVCSIGDAVKAKPDIALFSAGAGVSRQWAEAFADAGTFVIDNSSAWRMDANIPLVVPEVNGHVLTADTKIIANPNCSTIQLVVVLAPLHRAFNIKRLVISTYQSVTGTGVAAVKQLDNERAGISGEMAYPYPIDLNCFPHGGSFETNGYTTEETKLVNESRKILGDNSIQVTATVVRIPVKGGHSESVNIEFQNEYDLNQVRELLQNAPGVIIQDDPDNNQYPMPLYAMNKDDVFVGRIRRDFTIDNGLNLWIVSDNLRKGAATNAVQIAELLRDKGLV
jgi:aspartate-semialdehyde dehydrogenase